MQRHHVPHQGHPVSLQRGEGARGVTKKSEHGAAHKREWVRGVRKKRVSEGRHKKRVSAGRHKREWVRGGTGPQSRNPAGGEAGTGAHSAFPQGPLGSARSSSGSSSSSGSRNSNSSSSSGGGGSNPGLLSSTFVLSCQQGPEGWRARGVEGAARCLTPGGCWGRNQEGDSSAWKFGCTFGRFC